MAGTAVRVVLLLLLARGTSTLANTIAIARAIVRPIHDGHTTAPGPPLAQAKRDSRTHTRTHINTATAASTTETGDGDRAKLRPFYGIFIHIPKTGGHYVLNTLFNAGDQLAEHRTLAQYDVGIRVDSSGSTHKTRMATLNNGEKAHVIFVTRDPCAWSQSMWKFFAHPPAHPILNRMGQYVKQFENVNQFVTGFLTDKRQAAALVSAPWDTYYMQAGNALGPLTNYMLYFFNYEGPHEDASIRAFFHTIHNGYVRLRQEHLTSDLIAFATRLNIQLNTSTLHTKPNTSLQGTSHTDGLTDATIELIKYKERIYMEVFYPQNKARKHRTLDQVTER